MPRDIGTMCGVNNTRAALTSLALAATPEGLAAAAAMPSSCSISAVWRWVPATLYGRMLSPISGKCVPSDGERPAPDAPLLASMMMPSGRTRPAANSGATARIDAVG